MSCVYTGTVQNRRYLIIYSSKCVSDTAYYTDISELAKRSMMYSTHATARIVIMYILLFVRRNYRVARAKRTCATTIIDVVT